MENTCKDCEAFILDDDAADEGSMPGVCILNPPQMIAGVEEGEPVGLNADGTVITKKGEQIVMSAFPKVDGRYTRCLKIILSLGLLATLCNCAPRESLGGQSILGATFRNMARREREAVRCRTYKNAYQQIITECN